MVRKRVSFGCKKAPTECSNHWEVNPRSRCRRHLSHLMAPPPFWPPTKVGQLLGPPSKPLSFPSKERWLIVHTLKKLH